MDHAPVTGRLERAVVPPRPAGADLTAQQLLLWAGERRNPGTARYSEAALFFLDAEIETERFAAALDAVAADCDALRTVIDESSGRPRQVVSEVARWSLAPLDLVACPDPGLAARVECYRRAARGFDLGSSLVDSALFRVARNRFAWFVHQHQLISDAWSFSLLFDRVARRYADLRHAVDSPHPASPPFADYVAHEREVRDSLRHGRSTDYWRAKLAAPQEPLRPYGEEMPFATGRVERVSRMLERCTAAPLRQRAAQAGGPEDANLFIELCVALAAFLYRVSGARRFLIGAPFANRPSRIFKETLGSFMHVCPLQIDIGRRETFASLRAKVAREVFATARHQHVAVRNPVQQPLYEVALNLVRFSAVGRAFAGQPVRVEWPSLGFGNVPFLLCARDFGTAGDLALDFDLSAQAFDAGRRGEIVEQFVRMLHAGVADPGVPIDAVGLLSAADERRILVEWNRTAKAPPTDATFVDLFAAQVRAHPERIAIEVDSTSITYRELSFRAEHLSRRIAGLGVGAESVVGVLAERGVELIVALIAILRAGGAYMPLDPRGAIARTLRIVRASACRLLLRDRANAALADALCRHGDWPQHARWIDIEAGAQHG